MLIVIVQPESCEGAIQSTEDFLCRYVAGISCRAYNPTGLNRQGTDVGTQYRSIILCHNEAQQQTAREIIEEMQPYFDKPIVTEVVPFSKFLQSHQDYYPSNPEKAYCRAVITPKLQKIRALMGKALKKKPSGQEYD